jgi:DNA-binding CsgD family transcriptional regulator
VSSASSKVDDLANSGARRVKAQTLGIPSPEDARSEKVNNRWIWIQESRWIRTWDRVSGPRKKRLENLGAGIARLQGAIPRQLETVGAIAESASGIQVARSLGISPREVSKYWC